MSSKKWGSYAKESNSVCRLHSSSDSIKIRCDSCKAGERKHSKPERPASANRLFTKITFTRKKKQRKV